MPNFRACSAAMAAAMIVSGPAGAQLSAPGHDVVEAPTGRIQSRGVVAPVELCCEPGADRLGFDEHVGCGKAAALRARFAAGRPPADDRGDGGGGGLREASGETDVLHNKVDIEFVLTGQQLIGSNEMTVQSKVNGLTQFTFRLRNQFVISLATVNGNPVVVTSPSTTTRVVTLDRAYDQGEVFTLRIAYSGLAVSRGFGSIDFVTQNGQPLVSTLSEAYYAYTWWPCKDGDVGAPGDNADKATFEIAITGPAAMRSVSNGLLQGVDTLTGSRKRYRWATDYPMATYLACFSSTNYNTWTQTYTYPLSNGGTGSMPVEFNIYPASDNAGNRASWEKCLAMLPVYRGIYGEYPFINEKYGIYQFNFSGGMEHQTNTGQGTFDEGVTSHELGHQWWGDNVTCKTWSDIWLNEGFATYTEALWIERRPGSSGLPALFSAMAARRPAFFSDSVYVTDTTDMNRIFSSNTTYKKGAWVLHQLRHVVGDQTFFNILGAYRAVFQGSAATSDDFAAVASAVSSRDLSWFFSEWVYGIGAPAYVVSWQPTVINGSNYVRLRVRQVQASPMPVFSMPIDIRVNQGAASQVFTIWNNAVNETYLLPVAAPATGLVFDENNWVLTSAATQSESYSPGPPVLVQTSPQPGASVPISQASGEVLVTFSDDVAATAAAFSFTGPGGAVPYVFAYSSATDTAALLPAAPLAPGEYTVTVQSTLQANGQTLDGEIANPDSPASLPSGDGQPGGAAVFRFRVLGSDCPADWEPDGIIQPSDVAAYVNAWFISVTQGTLTADFDGNEEVNPADVAVFVNTWYNELINGC